MGIITSETKKVFKQYLKTIASESGSKFNEIQAIIYCKSDYMPAFAAAGKNGAIRTESGKIRSFLVRELIGRTLEGTYALVGINIEERVSKILKKVHSDNPEIPANEMLIVATAHDSRYKDIRLFLYQKTTEIKQLSWEYLLEDEDVETEE